MKAEILLELYGGAYGPTLRIETHNVSDLIAVRQVFTNLANGDATVSDFAEALQCRIEGIKSLAAQVVAKELTKPLTVVRSGAGAPAILWSNTQEQWGDIAAMVTGLIAQDAPGHQYLTRENSDDALVELCYQEFTG